MAAIPQRVVTPPLVRTVGVPQRDAAYAGTRVVAATAGAAHAASFARDRRETVVLVVSLFYKGDFSACPPQQCSLIVNFV